MKACAMNTWLARLAQGGTVIGLLALLLVAAGGAQAQSAPASTENLAQAAPAPAAPAAAAPAAPAPPQVLGFDFTSFVDVGLQSFSTGNGKFNAPNLQNKCCAEARTFDFDSGVALQNIDLNFQKTPESGFGGLLNITLGKDADTIAAYGTIDKKKGPQDGVNQMVDLTQLYGYYATGPVSFILGKYVTHAGQEVIKSRDDTNFSRSILFGFAIPFTHTGARATYKASDTLSLMLGANEGWDTVTGDNGGLTTEFDAEWAPSKKFSLFGTYLSGKQALAYYTIGSTGAVDISKDASGSVLTGTRTLLDLVATYNVSDALSLALNYDSGSQDGFAKGMLISNNTTAAWSGTALYANYTINDNWRTSIRYESFSDPDSYRAVNDGTTNKGATWSEATVTVAYMGINKLELRGEIRSDSADQKIFNTKNSDTDGSSPSSSMMSIGAEAIYKFF